VTDPSMTAALPPEAIDAMESKLLRLLASPTSGTSDKERHHLRTPHRAAPEAE
jgi:hypothetical protein